MVIRRMSRRVVSIAKTSLIFERYYSYCFIFFPFYYFFSSTLNFYSILYHTVIGDFRYQGNCGGSGLGQAQEINAALILGL